MRNVQSPVVVVAMLCGIGIASAVRAGDVPPRDSRPASAVVKSVEAQDLGVITSVEFDDGLWEIEVQQGSREITLYIDPASLQEKRRETEDSSTDDMPPRDAKPLSDILASVEAQGAGTITEVEFDDGVWEIELQKDGRKRTMHINPTSGEPRRR